MQMNAFDGISLQSVRFDDALKEALSLLAQGPQVFEDEIMLVAEANDLAMMLSS